MANVKSVGIDLAPSVASGQLTTLSLNAGAAIANDHYLTIEDAIERVRPSRIVIDPISALQKSGGAEIANLVVERLTEQVRARGITAVMTAVSSSQVGELENTTSHISTIADTWIHLSFAVRGGERNRTLTIVKSRGTAHSNQVREMILSHAGIQLRDFYQVSGDFLLGTARLEREQRDKREREARANQISAMLQELDDRRSSIRARLQETERELRELNARVERVTQESADARAAEERDLDAIALNREGPVDGG